MDLRANAGVFQTFEAFDIFNLSSKSLRSLGLTLERRRHNQCPPVERLEFSCLQCNDHSKPLIGAIINALKESGLKEYTFHTGTAFSTRYIGPRLQFKSSEEEEVFELKNEIAGLSLQFRVVESLPLGPALYVLFLIRKTERQGSYAEIKRMLLDEMWTQIFEPAGFSLIFGKAIWSQNSKVRGSSSNSEDWRSEYRYVGLDEDLQPILVSGLRLLYYRMGFFQLRQFSDQFEHDHLGYFSRTVESGIREALGEDQWQQLTALRRSANRNWKKLVEEREGQLGQVELMRRIDCAQFKRRNA